MKLDLFTPTKSTFLTAEKDIFNIVDKMLNNENLKKLLYYPVKDAYAQANLTQEQSLSLIHKNIRVIPKIQIDEEVESYVIITFDGFTTNANNPEFRDNIITFDIICHMDTWIMNGYQLRPYKIMGEIDGMLNNQKLNGIGTTEFVSANQLLLNNELAGYTLMYRVVNDV